MRRISILAFMVATWSWIIPGGWAHGSAGSSGQPTGGTVFSDFNNDGFADLAIGVAVEGAGAVTGAGAVNVLYGSAKGLQTTLPEDQFWHQNSTGVRDTAEAEDAFGFTLTAGDFNNDGFADLAIGVPNEDVGAVGDAGAVNVLYGSAGGLQATSPDDQFWHQNRPAVLDTAEDSDRFGSSLGSGDFNSDGYADLAIGVPGESVGAVLFAGGANVLYGSAGGLQATSPDDQLWHQNRPGVRDTAEVGDNFGTSLGDGDFNNDGYADLAIGVLLEDVGAVSGAGAADVLYGSAGGLQATSPDDQFWHQNRPGVLDAAETDDLFGSSLDAGDFNTDGFADLAIGVPTEDVKVLFDAGAANVLYGSAGGLQATSPDDQFWHQDGEVGDVAEDADDLGHSLRAGDFNNDGFADLALGTPGESLGAIYPGAVNVLYGSGGGLQATSPDDQFWHQDSPGVQDNAGDVDFFGASLGAGDFNNDGFADLAIGVIFEDLGDAVNAGAVNVLYGSDGGLQATSPNDQFWHQSGGVKGFAEDGDQFGFLG